MLVFVHAASIAHSRPRPQEEDKEEDDEEKKADRKQECTVLTRSIAQLSDKVAIDRASYLATQRT